MGEIISLLPMELLTLVSLAICIVLLVVVILMSVKLSKLRSNYVRMINGGSPHNVEAVLIELQERLREQANEQKINRQSIESITGAMEKMKSQIGVYRYNAFGEGGSDLSFSVAIVDQAQNGVVFTGIHNREQVYVYAKPLSEGQSKYTLSPEEKEAIARSSRTE